MSPVTGTTSRTGGHIGISYDAGQWNANQVRLRATPEQIRLAVIEGLKRGAASLRKRIKEAADSGLSDWAPLARYSPTGANVAATLGSTSHGWKGGSSKPQGEKFLGALKGLFRYAMDKTSETSERPVAIVGVLADKTGVGGFRLFQKFQMGGEVAPVNFSMRKYWGVLGIPLSKKNTLRQPARPLVEPVFEKNKRDIGEKIQAKISSVLRSWLRAEGKGVK